MSWGNSYTVRVFSVGVRGSNTRSPCAKPRKPFCPQAKRVACTTVHRGAKALQKNQLNLALTPSAVFWFAMPNKQRTRPNGGASEHELPRMKSWRPRQDGRKAPSPRAARVPARTSVFCLSQVRMRARHAPPHWVAYGDPGRIRTCDRLLRRQMLYPAELRSRYAMCGTPALAAPGDEAKRQRDHHTRYAPDLKLRLP